MKQIHIQILLYIIWLNSFCQNKVLLSKDTIDLKKSELWKLISSHGVLQEQYEYANRLSFSKIVYQSDSLKIDGLMIAPKVEGKYPVIIFNRGGNRDYNELSLKMLFFSTVALANDGYIILASNYRSRDEFGGKDLNDVLNLINVANELENADTSRIGMFGWSRGGMMTYLSLKKSTRIKTAVIGNGPSNLFLSIKNKPELEINPISQCIPNYWFNKDAELKKRSAIFWADSLNKKSSLLLLCGRYDKEVNFQESVIMSKKLDSINYDCELKIYETNHSFKGKRAELDNELIHWFNSRLKKAKPYKKPKIAITIDDVPNTKKIKSNSFQSHLLKQLDSLNIPIAIFVNEGLIYKTNDTTKNINLLENWIKRNYITLGNHTFSHSRLSEVGYNDFKGDVTRGHNMLHRLALKYNKPLSYFRFPYNDLGIDSVQQHKIDSFLISMHYLVAPFTVESSDWMFNAIYEHYISNSEFEKANEIGNLYVAKTLDYIRFFDSLSIVKYGRSINQIYLCHDNSINAKYLQSIIYTLQSKDYEFVSLDNALNDSVYQQKNRYYKKWGISWLYRWILEPDIRKEWMKHEPDNSEIETLYSQLIK